MPRKKKIVIDAPKHPVVRYRFTGDDRRTMELDFRGVRNPHYPLHGRLQVGVGKPRRFVSPEHLQSMIDEYFESCNGPLVDKWGNLVYDKEGNLVKTQVRPYSVAELSLYLGISTNTFKNYRLGRLDTILDEMRAETDDALTFATVLARARQRIEAYAERRLYDKEGQFGAKFVLDNAFGWKTQKEQAEIEKLISDMVVKQQELAMKQNLLGDSSDDTITINIVRGRKDHEDD